MSQLTAQFQQYVDAAFSGIWIQSFEHDEAIHEIEQLCDTNSGWQVLTWDVADGLRRNGVAPGGDTPSGLDPVAVLRAMPSVVQDDQTMILILKNFHKFLQSAETLQVLHKQIAAGRSRRLFYVVLSPVVQIPIELEKQFVIIEHSLPDRETLRSIATHVATEPGELPEGDVLERVLDAASGLSRFEAEGIFALAVSQQRHLNAQTIWNEKAKQLKKSALLELHQGTETFADLGGLESLKQFTRRILGKRYEHAKFRPKGILLLGPPGCLRGDTPIYDPVAGATLSVRERFQQGSRFSVLSRDAQNRPVIIEADPPQQFPAAPMLEFTLDTGDRFAVTHGHAFWQGSSYVTAGSLYAKQQAGVVSRLPSSSGRNLAALLQGVRRYLRTVASSLVDCPIDLCSYDARPPLKTGIAQVVAPFQADVQQHSLASSLLGAQDAAALDSLSILSCRPPRQGFLCPSEIGNRCDTSQRLWQQHSVEVFDLPYGTPSKSCGSQQYIGAAKIVQIRPVAAEEYYDFHVPLLNNYWACGVWHSNTGKSAFAKALGNETQRPTLSADLGRLMGSLLGQSQANMRQMLQITDAMAPDILFVDEIEKSLAGVSGSGQSDSGTSAQMFGTFLTWLNDHDSDVFVIATANDVSKLPPEFTRAERFDAVFFIDFPTAGEREQIWQHYIRMYELTASHTLIEVTDAEWSGAEIKACCRLAKLLGCSLEEASQSIVPVSVTAAEKIAALRTWAEGRCLSAANPGIYKASVAKHGSRRAVARPSKN